MLQDDGTVNWHEAITRLTEWVRPRLQEPADADELVQAILERLVVHADQLQTAGNPLGWMHRIATNAIIDAYRRPKRTVALPRGLPAETADPAAEARHELAGCIRPLLMHLDPVSREALLVTDLGGKSQVEAAREAGVAVSTMKSRIQRGRRKLRQALRQCCHVELDRRRGIAGFSPKQTEDGSPGACCKSEPPTLAPCTPPSAACRSNRQSCAAQVPAASR